MLHCPLCPIRLTVVVDQRLLLCFTSVCLGLISVCPLCRVMHFFFSLDSDAGSRWSCPIFFNGGTSNRACAQRLAWRLASHPYMSNFKSQALRAGEAGSPSLSATCFSLSSFLFSIAVRRHPYSSLPQRLHLAPSAAPPQRSSAGAPCCPTSWPHSLSS